MLGHFEILALNSWVYVQPCDNRAVSNNNGIINYIPLNRDV